MNEQKRMKQAYSDELKMDRIKANLKKCPACNDLGAVKNLQEGPDAWQICECQTGSKPE